MRSLLALRPICAAFLASLALPACVFVGPVTQEQAQTYLANLRDGQATLDGSPSRIAVFVSFRDEYFAAYQRHDWPTLASQIQSANWRSDIGYYLLGAAAEGLGWRGAARGYYQAAADIAANGASGERCASSPQLCGPINLPGDAQSHANALRDAEPPVIAARSPAARIRPVASPVAPPAMPGLAVAANALAAAQAPQELMRVWAAHRLDAGAPLPPPREHAFEEQMVAYLDPALADQSRGNAALQARAWESTRALIARPANRRVVLGLNLQLGAYDAARHALRLRYPVLFDAAQLRVPAVSPLPGRYPAPATRGAPATSTGSECVWSAQDNYPRPDLGDPFLVVGTYCKQLPGPRDHTFMPPGTGNELPPFFLLKFRRGALQDALPLDEDRAGQVVAEAGSQRTVWAELVIDLVGAESGYAGPFDVVQNGRALQQPAAIFEAVPVGLRIQASGAGGASQALLQQAGDAGALAPMSGASFFHAAAPVAGAAPTPAAPSARPPAVVPRPAASAAPPGTQWIETPSRR